MRVRTAVIGMFALAALTGCGGDTASGPYGGGSGSGWGGGGGGGGGGWGRRGRCHVGGRGLGGHVHEQAERLLEPGRRHSRRGRDDDVDMGREFERVQRPQRAVSGITQLRE